MGASVTTENERPVGFEEFHGALGADKAADNPLVEKTRRKFVSGAALGAAFAILSATPAHAKKDEFDRWMETYYG